MSKDTAGIVISSSAIAQIAKIIANEKDASALRISVEGGGCSGFSYKYDLVNKENDDDLVIERDGAKVLIDHVSSLYMQNSVIDFIDNLAGQSFQIKNPNVVASCGCGVSFSI